MLTRCPSCETHFRVTLDQLKARSGRVRCGACQKVFNALDTLIEQQILAIAPPPAESSLSASISAAPLDFELDVADQPEALLEEEAVSPSATARRASFARPPCSAVASSAPTFESLAEIAENAASLAENEQKTPVVESVTELDPLPEFVAEPSESATEVEAEIEAEAEPIAQAIIPPRKYGAEFDERASAFLEAEAETEAEIEPDPPAWSETFPDPPPAPRRWPWVVLCLFASLTIALQATLAFRVEMVVLWPETRPALLALCEVAGCDIGLPMKIGLIGIEASDLFPDSEHKGRLVLTATLKSRAPFAQQYPHIELTLTDTADRAIARKVLAPTEFLPASTAIVSGMTPNADIAIAIGIEPTDITASGYRLTLFYP